MLIKDFYQIAEIVSEETNIVANIKLNVQHEVYKGHFPTQAVVPGVIQLQIIKEILEKHFEQKLFMGNVIQVKYLIPITPKETPELIINITYKKTDENILKSNITIGFNDIIFTKAKINFIY
jgi:3-hydroxyacyl-[acyl-carrier-protein] dehydratase